ncbi:DUF6268 family outer membrane beta-barrel protein [Pendulispora brunnea]|uniref:DUF6268 family outer membrane beta-barrel protein n=1 Tax=Pendulispora brunnea TaxID=2905690 RepID=A0ABZ2KGV8_9BACT
MRRTTFAALAVCAVVCETNAASAQATGPTASVSYERSTIGLEKPQSRDTKDSIGIQTLRFRAAYPIPLGERTILVPGLSYDLLHFPETTSKGLPTDTLHAPMVNVSLIQLLGSRVMIGGEIRSGLSSDFQERISSDDLALTVAAMGTYKFADNFSLGAYLGYNRQSRTFFPAVALNWDIRERFRIRGWIPASTHVEFRATPWLTVGIREALDFDVFHLSGRKYGEGGTQFSYMTINVGPQATVSFSDTTHLDIFASASVMRRYEWMVDGDSKRDGYLPSVITFGARLWFGSAGWRGEP